MRRALLFLLAPLAALAAPAVYENPVLKGDYPDPSIIRVGDAYWASATSSDWAPEFPLLYSKDLVNWEIRGAVFAHRPAWAVGQFWAPELVQHKGRFFCYYTARKRSGPLSVAVASADKPEGPYTDHGPLISQHDGSIDGVVGTDFNGDRYLVWKEDSNSIKQPTPIFAVRLADDGVTMQGEPKELMRNDQPWEGNLVEGPFIQRHGDYLYMFYSGNACCGRNCNYALGVARAKNMLGPWEKHPKNPILAGNDRFKCPGHGSLVEDGQGRTYLFYHAVARKDDIFVGRQAMLDEVRWEADGWPSINGGRGPSGQAPMPLASAQKRSERRYSETFAGRLGPGWEWPQAESPAFTVNADGLRLSGGILARRTVEPDYQAVARLKAPQGKAGIAAWGNRRNAVGLSFGGGEVELWEFRKGEAVRNVRQPFSGGEVELQLTAREGYRYSFAYRKPGAAQWTPIGEQQERTDLPPWDLGVRVALTAEGGTGVFREFRMEPLER